MNSFEFNMNFDKVPESKEVFIDLVKQCDIWINSVPNIGKHGPTDELAMSANPKLVIVEAAKGTNRISLTEADEIRAHAGAGSLLPQPASRLLSSSVQIQKIILSFFIGSPPHLSTNKRK